jgi:glycosyltransferase involved in cell wall biosynthesis
MRAADGTRLRIGYFNQDFFPEVGAGPARVFELARLWREAGADVTVVAGMPHRRMPGRPDGAIHPDYSGKLFVEEDWHGVRVLRSWLYASRNRSFTRTLANNASYMVTSALHTVLRTGGFDVLIASSPPFLAHVTGEVARIVKRVPLVLEIRDLWPDYLVEMGVLKNRWARRAVFGLEKYLLEHAAHCVVVTESFRARIAEKGFPCERIEVIPNGVDVRQYYREIAEPPLAALQRQNGEFIVGYLGNFGAGQELRTVVEAAARLEQVAPDIRFVMAGDGKEKMAVEARARELGVKNVSIHPPISRDETRAFYNACDICLVPLAPLSIFQTTVPSKMFEIMACERPVLASLAGEAARILEDSAGGLVTPPGDAEAMAHGILSARGMSAPQQVAMGTCARRYVEEHYSRSRLAAFYLDVLERVAAERRVGASTSRSLRHRIDRVGGVE